MYPLMKSKTFFWVYQKCIRKCNQSLDYCISPVSHLNLTFMLPTFMTPVYHAYVTNISLSSHLYLTNISHVSHLYITCISTIYHLYITFISPVSHLFVTCISPLSTCVIQAQTQPSWFLDLQNMINGVDDTIDRLHNYRLEYHHASDVSIHLSKPV